MKKGSTNIFLFIVILFFLSSEGFCQRFIYNTTFSNHQFYDSGVYSFKERGNTRANLVNIGLIYNWQRLDLGINACLGTLKNYNYSSQLYPELNVMGANILLNYHFISNDLYFIDPFVSLNYGLKSISLNNQTVNYKQASYGLGINFKISKSLKLSFSESFNLSLKNEYFNNLQTAIGVLLFFPGPDSGIPHKDITPDDKIIKNDSIAYIKPPTKIESPVSNLNINLTDSLKNIINIQKKTLDNLLSDNVKLLEKSKILKNEIAKLQMNYWDNYTVIEVLKDTLITLSTLPKRRYATCIVKKLPDHNELVNLTSIKGRILLCKNTYNFYKICLELNASDSIIPTEFLKIYPEAVIWNLE